MINYRDHPEWQDEVLRVTGGEGAHVVLEAVSYTHLYTDSHFSKAFQRRYGVLPSALASGR